MDIYYQLREMTKVIAKLQLGAAFICLFFSIFFYQSHDIAVLCGYVCIAVSLYPILAAVNNKNFLMLLSCIALFNVSPIWFLYLECVIPGKDAYTYIEPVYRMQSLIYCSIFLFFINFLYANLSRVVLVRSTNFFSFFDHLKLKSEFFFKATLFAFIVPMIFFYFFYGSVDELWKSLTEGRSGGGGSGLLKRETVGGISSLFLPVNWIWQLAPLFGCISFIRNKQSAPFLANISLILGLIVIFFSFLGGSRAGMMLVAAPALFFLFYYNWDKGIKFWIFVSILMVFSIGVMELQVRFRGGLLEVLKDPAAAARAKGLESATTFDVTESSRDNNMYFVGLITKGYPDKYDYEGFGNFIAVLLNPIPRVLWPGKPLMDGQKDISHARAYITDGPLRFGTNSLTVSTVGEALIQGGIWGILVYAIAYVAFLLFFDGLIYYTKSKNPLVVGVFGIGVFLAFWGFRGFFALVGYLYPVLSLIFLLKYISKKGETNIYRPK